MSASHGPHYNLVVIGTGPAGEGAAMKAVKSGKTVAVVERFASVGGGCTHWGTIPSKALRRAIYHMNITHENPIFKRMDVNPIWSLPDLLSTANYVIQEQTDLRESFYDNNGVRLIPGQAKFVDTHTLRVEKEDAGHEIITADGFVIATGSRPYQPGDVDFSHPRVVDSDMLLRLSFTPKSITIYGAGVIGCEYASMLRNMHMEVNLINTRAQLLSYLDEEIVEALSYHFADRGILIRHNEECARVEPLNDCVILHLKSGKKIKSDVLLWANGRSGNSDGMGLENIGVIPNARGQLEVNENLQVKRSAANKDAPVEYLPNVYAAGDIIGPPALASASYDQGRFAATHFCLGHADYKLVADIPTGIFTTPEISTLGKTERELTQEKVPYEVGKSQFKYLARAQITGQTVGMLKLLFHRETFALLGIHCFGDAAAEIIHIGQAIMSQPPPHNNLHYFVTTTFNYPTMAEAYRVAALNGLDRAF